MTTVRFPRLFALAAALSLIVPVAARAQMISIDPVEPVEESSRIEIAPMTAPGSTWVAGLHASVIDRDGGDTSPYATLSLTRYRQQTYLRASFTAYRNTLRQVDAALPSTFYLGSVGAGGNFNDWVVDATLSYGRQNYGAIETPSGSFASNYGSTDYAAAGVRVGRVIRPASRWYLTPTVAVDYVDTKSLHHGFAAGVMASVASDFEVDEHLWTGTATLRLDRTFGEEEQNYLGVAISQRGTNNAITQLAYPSPFEPPLVLRKRDAWQDLEASGTLRLGRRVWLDGQVLRSFGAVAGDNTTVTLGLRLRL